MLLFLETFFIFIKKLMRYFHTIFLAEADKFIAQLDAKSARKIFYNIDLAEQINDPKLFKNCRMIFGNFGQNMRACKFDFLHFGTKPRMWKHWL